MSTSWSDEEDPEGWNVIECSTSFKVVESDSSSSSDEEDDDDDVVQHVFSRSTNKSLKPQKYKKICQVEELLPEE